MTRSSRASLRTGRLERLRTDPEPVERMDAGLQATIDRLLQVMKKGGYPALSAPQIGIPSRVIAIDLAGRGDGEVVLVNPEIESVSTERQVDHEGCASLPGVQARVRRPVHVTVTGRARTGQRVRIHAGGLLARILQHEIDHLNGVLFPDHCPPAERRRLLDRAASRPARCLLQGSGVREERERQAVSRAPAESRLDRVG